MRSLTPLLAILSLSIVEYPAFSQQISWSPKTEQIADKKIDRTNIDKDIVREILEIERDLERVLDRMAALELKRGEFSLERVMISKAFNQMIEKLCSSPRQFLNTAKVQEQIDQKSLRVGPRNAASTNTPSSGNDAAGSGNVNRREW